MGRAHAFRPSAEETSGCSLKSLLSTSSCASNLHSSPPHSVCLGEELERSPNTLHVALSTLFHMWKPQRLGTIVWGPTLVIIPDQMQHPMLKLPEDCNFWLRNAMQNVDLQRGKYFANTDPKIQQSLVDGQA